MTSIGVFWLYQGKVLGQTQRQDEGQQGIAGLIDSRLEHAAVWEAQQCFCRQFTELTGLEYFAIPRGRVLYVINSGPLVYLDRTLMNQQSKELIAAFFGFKPGTAKWRRDPHYTTGKDELMKLFGKTD